MGPDSLSVDLSIVGFGIKVLRVSRVPSVFERDDMVFLIVLGVRVRKAVFGDLLFLEVCGRFDNVKLTHLDRAKVTHPFD